MITNRTESWTLKPLGGGGGRNVEHHGSPTPLLPLERQILQEADVVTPPRRGAHGPRGRQAPEPQLPPGGARAEPQIFPDVRTRDVGSDRQHDTWSRVWESVG